MNSPSQYSHDDSRFGLGMAIVLLCLIALLLVAAVAWAKHSEIDEVTRAPGAVIPSSRLQTIQAVDGGIVKKLYVTEGQVVQRGERIVQLDPLRSQAVAGESFAKVAALRAMIARASAEIAGTSLVFPSGLEGFRDLVAAQRIQYDRRLSSLKEEIGVLENGLRLAESELSLNRPLARTGEVSQAEIIRLERQVNETRGQIAVRKNRYFSEAQSELSKAQDELAAASQVLEGRKEQLSQTEITAPVRGIIKNVRITTVGAVVRAAEEILQIIPLDDELQVEAKVRPADVGFLKPGLEATVKLDAYDYSVYGALKGRVSFISPDTLREESAREDIRYYRAIITITDNKLRSPRGETTEIIPGMTSMVEIKTGQKSVLDYLLKPITRTLGEAFTER